MRLCMQLLYKQAGWLPIVTFDKEIFNNGKR